MENFDELDAEEESRAGDVDLLDAENPPAASEVRISSGVPRQRGSTHGQDVQAGFSVQADFCST